MYEVEHMGRVKAVNEPWYLDSQVALDFVNRQYRVDDLFLASLMMHFDGTNGSTTFIDSAGSRTMTAHGGAQISTAKSKFGGASGAFDGVDGSYVSFNGDSNLDFGTGDFTIEFWIWLDGDQRQRIIIGNLSDGNPGLLVNGSRQIMHFGDGVNNRIDSAVVDTDTWNHYAICRKSGVIQGYLNGSAANGGGPHADTNNYIPGGNWVIGHDNINAGWALKGWLEELVIIKGYAKYTGDFTPPTAPYVAPSYIFTANPPLVDELIGTSRSSIGTAKTNDGRIQQFASNTLRITDLGLLTESVSTNELTSSEALNGGGWNQQFVGATPNVIMAPNGTLTGNRFTEGSIDDWHQDLHSLGDHDAGAIYTLSIFAKKGNNPSRYLTLTIQDDLSIIGIKHFDLSNGVAQSGGATGGIEAYADGWYRCWINITTINSGARPITAEVGIGVNFNGTDFDSYQGDGSSYIYVWGAQAEQNYLVPTSYIPTTTVAATRAAEYLYVKSYFDYLWGQSPATILFDFKQVLYLHNSDFVGLAGSNNWLHVYDDGINFYSQGRVSDGGPQLNATLGSGNWLTGAKIGLAWESNGRSLVGNAGTILSDSFTGASPTFFEEIPYAGGGAFLHKRMFVWSRRLPDTILKARTRP